MEIATLKSDLKTLGYSKKRDNSVLHSLKNLSGYSIIVAEGELGKVEQFYFDDEKWAVRYIVVNLGSWPTREKVLVSPIVVQEIDTANRKIVTKLTRDQLIQSPDIEMDLPISRQMEMQYLDYYKWPYYWTGAGIWGTDATLQGGFSIPPSFEHPEFDMGTMPTNVDKSDSHLRSTKEVFGYRVDAIDAEFGKLRDFIVDLSNWSVRYLVIDLRKWLPSKTVLISREWVESFSFRQRKIRVSSSQKEIQGSPGYNPDVPLSREYEDLLHEHYGRAKYWEKQRSTRAA